MITYAARLMNLIITPSEASAQARRNTGMTPLGASHVPLVVSLGLGDAPASYKVQHVAIIGRDCAYVRNTGRPTWGEGAPFHIVRGAPTATSALYGNRVILQGERGKRQEGDKCKHPF